MSCIQLYSFEPRKSNSNDNKKPERRVNRELIDRNGKTDWCDCGECVIMPTDEESVCCVESDIINNIRGSVECITQHISFDNIVLSIDALNTLRHFIVSKQAAPQHILLDLSESTNRTWRYLAYTQFIHWVNSWASLGKNKRKVIPSCVVHAIRTKYPQQEGEYVGFKAAAGCQAEFMD